MENAIGTSVTSPPFWIVAQTETARAYFFKNKIIFLCF
jgi:hypothetical protein